MKTFWQERSPRERLFLMAGAVLLAGVLLVQFVLVPAIDYRDDARRSYERASAMLADIRAGAGEAMALRQARAERPDGGDSSIRAVAGGTARRIGIAMTRLQPDGDGGLNVWFDDVDSELLYRWILEIRREHGVGIAMATIRKNADRPTVRAQVLLVGGEGG